MHETLACVYICMNFYDRVGSIDHISNHCVIWVDHNINIKINNIVDPLYWRISKIYPSS